MSVTNNNQNIIPFLWFDGQAEEAINLYTSIFPNSKVLELKKWGNVAPFPAEWVMNGTIVLDGLKMYFFDAGPQFKFNESISFFVTCKTQQEIDNYWQKLGEGGAYQPCGWLKDKFGLSWQIVPAMLSEKLSNGEPKRVGQMMQELQKMQKLDIAKLEEAYNQ